MTLKELLSTGKDFDCELFGSYDTRASFVWDDDEPCEVCPFHERDLDMYKKNVIAYLTNDTF